MKKILIVLVGLIAVAGLAACGGEKEGVAYGKVHGQYVGIVTLQVKGGKVTGGSIDELYLPYNFANVNAQVSGANAAVLEQVSSDVIGQVNAAGTTTTYFAKYVKVGDHNVTAETVAGTGEALNVVYKIGGVDMKEWIATQANADAYAKAVQDGKVFVATSAFAAHATLKSQYAASLNLTGIDQFLKSKTNYGGTNWNWKGAMAQLVNDVFKGTAMDLNLANATQVERVVDDKEIKEWHVGDFNTGATLVDFKDYYNVAKVAFANAK